jgi:hypothetical protein
MVLSMANRAPSDGAVCRQPSAGHVQAMAGISQHTSEAHAGGPDRATSSMAISGLLRNACCYAGTCALAMRGGSPVQLSGRNGHSPTITGTSPLASVVETSVWQLAVLLSTDAYCRLRPPNGCPSLAVLCREDQHGILASDKPARLNKQFRSQRGCVPDTSRHEMMQLIVLSGSQLRRHWLNTLPVGRVRSGRRCRAGTSVVVPCGTDASGMAPATAPTRSASPIHAPK